MSDCLERLPDAFASARRQARDEDENIEQAAVDRRADELNVYTAKRAREWTGNLGRLQQANARGLNAHAAAIAAELRRLDQSHGEGKVQIEVQANGPMHLTHIDPQDATGRRAGTTGSTRTLAEALILAGKRPPHGVPELERTLDRKLANEHAPGGIDIAHAAGFTAPSDAVSNAVDAPGGPLPPSRLPGIRAPKRRTTGRRPGAEFER